MNQVNENEFQNICSTDEKDIEKINLKQLSDLEERGKTDPEAQDILGRCYLFGYVVQKDIKKAKTW
jgi:TPR repeat protein